MNEKGFSKIVLIILAIALVGAVGYLGLIKNRNHSTQQIIPPSLTNNKILNNDLKSYVNTKYGFSFKYPKDLNAYEWQPNSEKYALPNLVTEKGTGNNIILSSLDYTDENVDYPHDKSYIRIMEVNGTYFLKNATDAEGIWNNLGGKETVNKFLEKKTINGIKFIIFKQLNSDIWSYRAFFANQGKFFSIDAGDLISKELFNSLVSSFKFTSTTEN